MVGQEVIKSGILDIKTPASGLMRGWRYQAWKTRRVDLVSDDGGGSVMILVFRDDVVENTYNLDDVSDVTMIASKTHAHAFEIVSKAKSLVILSGNTELQSRDWIWCLRKLFWPQAMVQLSVDDKKKVRLLKNVSLAKHNIREGIYQLDASVSGLTMKFVSTTYSAEDSRLTPVEPFAAEEQRASLSLPLTTIGQYKLENGLLEIITTPDSEFGSSTFLVEAVHGERSNIHDVIEVIKTAVFSATNCLHDCIASSYWNEAIKT